ncbi:hypothetical protein DIPPA_06033 [Diplonema papillatum]|nr:hypothetical protein DIPPA_06033 [Diplonema papillatum]
MSTLSEKRVIELAHIEKLLDKQLSVCGPREGFEQLLQTMPEVVHTHTVAGFFRGNSIKPCQLREGADVTRLISVAAHAGFSAYLATWALPDPERSVLDAFQTKDGRKDGSINPFGEIVGALHALGVDGRVVRTGANGYEIKVPRDSEPKWVDLAALLEGPGLALRHNGRYIMTKEGKDKQKEAFKERAKGEYGVTGVDKVMYHMEVLGAMHTAGVEPESELRVFPVYGLKSDDPKFVAYVVRGLGAIDEAELARKAFQSPFGTVLRFGMIEALMRPAEPLNEGDEGTPSEMESLAEVERSVDEAAATPPAGPAPQPSALPTAGAQPSEPADNVDRELTGEANSGEIEQLTGTKRGNPSEPGLSPPNKTPVKRL